MIAPVPPEVQVSWRWLLLPHERWIVRQVSNRFQRLGLRNPPQLRLVAKHGTLGLALCVVATMTASFFGLVGLVGVASLVVSDQARFPYWIFDISIGGELYALARLLQMLPTKPTQADLDFLTQATPRG